MARRAAGEAGFTMVEILAVLVIMSVLATFAVSAALEGMRRERVRGAAHQVRATIATARIKAQSLNRATRFAIDTSSRVFQVIDTKGTAATTDDQVLSQTTLDDRVIVGMPDGTTPVTLQQVGATTVFYAQFEQSGTVSGSGQIALKCGDAFARITLMAGGGMRVERWDGGAWRAD